MSAVDELQEALRHTTAVILDAERALARMPTDRGTLIALMSFRQQQAELEEKLLAATESVGVDVCSYRATGPGTRFAGRVFEALVEFQRLFTLAYAAERARMPRRSSVVSDRDREASSFGLAYTFSGSIGIVLTLSNERLLFGGTELDEAMADIHAMANAQTADEIRGFGERLGRAVVRELYRWCQVHAEGDLGAAIDWQRGNAIRLGLLIEPRQLAHLQQIIDQTSDQIVERLELFGTLVGIDVQTRRFHFVPDDADAIRGGLGETVGGDATVSIPGRYKVVVQRTTVYKYSTAEESVHYFLESLTSP